MLENFVLIIGLILIGTLGRRSNLLPFGTANVLNTFVLNVSLPAMILLSIPKLHLDESIIYPVAAHWIFYCLNILLVLIASKVFHFKKSVLGVLLVVSCLGNTAFLGIPMVGTYLGSEAISYAVLYDQLGSGIAFIITGAFILPLFSGDKKKSLKEVLIQLLSFPCFVALMMSFLLIKFPLPQIFNHFLESISMTLVPCSMIAVGYQMKFRMKFDKVIPITVGLVIKMIILPVMAILLYKFLNQEELSLKASVLQVSMPPMITAGAMAMSIDLENEIAAALVGYGLIIAFITTAIVNLMI